MSMTIGVCGADHPHGGGHLAALNWLDEVGKLLIWDEEPSRAEAVAGDSPKAEVVSEFAPLIEERAVDAVVVLLRSRDAGPWTLKAVRAGLYVYGDKPGARTAAKMREIVAACDETGAHFHTRVEP